MTEAVAERMAALNADESRFMFESFDHAAACRFRYADGGACTRRSLAGDHRQPAGLAWSCSAQLLARTTAENEAWLNHEANTSLPVRDKHRAAGRAVRGSGHRPIVNRVVRHRYVLTAAASSRCASTESGSSLR